MPNKSTPDYLFEKANQCFRRSRTDSSVRVELEALGNEFMVEAIDLDIKLQNLAKGKELDLSISGPLLSPKAVVRDGVIGRRFC